MAFNYPLYLDKTSAVYYAMSLISLCKVVFVSKVRKVSFDFFLSLYVLKHVAKDLFCFSVAMCLKFSPIFVIFPDLIFFNKKCEKS